MKPCKSRRIKEIKNNYQERLFSTAVESDSSFLVELSNLQGIYFPKHLENMNYELLQSYIAPNYFLLVRLNFILIH